jgi:hypothetical protein
VKGPQVRRRRPSGRCMRRARGVLAHARATTAAPRRRAPLTVPVRSADATYRASGQLPRNNSRREVTSEG